MSQEKLEGLSTEHQQPLAADVYDSAAKFNLQMAVKGPAILYALTKASEQVSNTHLVTGVGGLVMGALSFFGNRHFRSKGDDSANAYMGLMLGGAQGASGLMLILLEISKTLCCEPNSPNRLSTMLENTTLALSLTLASLLLVNSFLYGDGPKNIGVVRSKMD